MPCPLPHLVRSPCLGAAFQPAYPSPVNNLLVSRVGKASNISLVRLNRPKALNALNAQLMSELRDTLAQTDADKDLKCTVLTGSAKAFAAGADIVSPQNPR